MNESKYESIASFVRRLLEQRAQVGGAELPSEYWQDFVSHFAYVFALPAPELRRIRFHSYHLTSDIYQRYYFADAGFRELLLRGQAHFAARLGGFYLEEGERGIGVSGEHGRVSHDLLRYMGVLVDLYEAGALRRESAHRVLELGGGYGGLARALCSFAPRTRYVICDLEETLFFSGVYLSNEFGADHVHLLEGERQLAELGEGDVALGGQVRFSLLADQDWDLVINQQSMQEMTAAQVSRYLEYIAQRAGLFYTCNLQSHGELAEQKGIVSDLDALFDERLGAPVWVSEAPAPHEQFGDNVLQRKLYRCR
ncbi:MAG: hypothetical protein CSA62_08125 [Planctomycetota bacterium]|nr:MAG: hypothetical protein CSA62_08125 [Planctomycetota bacterium]